MFKRMRAATIAAVAAAMLLSSVPTALAAPSALVKQLRADVLSARSAGVRAVSTETTIPVVADVWYKDVDNVQNYDGYFGSVGGAMYKDVWIMVEFKDAMGMTLGTEEILSNEYVVEGQGTWSAVFPEVPAGTVDADAMVFGTPTTQMGFMPASFTASPTIHVLPATDRHLEGDVTYGMLPMEGMPNDPTLADLVVSIVEDHMGDFHDVALGGLTSTTSTTLLPGVATPWRSFGGRAADMPTDIRFVNYSAVEYSTITARASTKVPAYGAPVALSGVVMNSSGLPVDGIPVVALSNTGAVSGPAITGLDGGYSISVKSSAKTSYTVNSLGDSYLAAAASAPVTIDPKVYLSAPTAPRSIYRNRYFTSIGYLKPRHSSGSYPVLIKAYRKIGGKWVLKKTIKAKASNYSSYSKYTAKYYLPTAGSWKLVATHDSAAHYPSVSAARYLTVK